MKRVPWAGVAVSALALVVMTAVAWRLWDALPDVVTTRRPTADRPGAHVPKAVMAAAMPATLVGIGVVMAGATAAGERLRPLLPPMLMASPAAQRRAMNVLFVLLPPVLTAVHTGVLADAAGHAFPLERTVGVAVGLLTTGLGLALPRLYEEAPRHGGRRARRLGGPAMAGIGVACAAGVFVLPPFPVTMACALAAGVVMILSVVSSFAGTVSPR
ncbi:hypothetical protein E1286_17685 [Nonomuraea terrae]|uniref:DUF1648 domain-containing protein n=1 Tax=Nonomuraea terrae TaxID=2530383 RepID=A0A4R4YRW0_9ACTN|nr:hypothetical protein [Nonomuraea terrae]TDD47370.1 hypothetical protein E1286_17685 [Nonomuraea terrae]